MNTDKEKEFISRMGFAKKALRPEQHGILADWGQIPQFTKNYRTGWKFYLDDKKVYQGGMGEASWSYRSKKGEESLSIQVTVFSKGQKAAIERMIMKATATTTMFCPYGPASESVGDFAAMSLNERIKDSIMWIYYNVLVEIDASDNRYNVLPMAKSMQAFMEKHVSTEIDKHLPRVERIEVNPPRVGVGKKFQVKLYLPEDPASSDWMIDIDESLDKPGYLNYVTRDGLTATFIGKKPGQGLISVQVLDKKTLLSPVLEISVEIEGGKSKQ